MRKGEEGRQREEGRERERNREDTKEQTYSAIVTWQMGLGCLGHVFRVLSRRCMCIVLNEIPFYGHKVTYISSIRMWHFTNVIIIT